MSEEPAWKLCRRVAAETFERIREDRRRAPVRVARLLATIEEQLLEPDLMIDDLRRASGELDPNLSTRFAEKLGLPPRSYVIQARMEIAGRMLTAGNHKIWEIALEVGYSSGSAFSRAFTEWYGKSPTAFREEARAAAAGEPPPPATPPVLVSREELRRACDGKLDAAQATAVMARLEEVHDQIRSHYHDPVPPVERPSWVEPAMAERLWRWIEILPHEAQTAAVTSQAGAFHTPALFNRLCTESLVAGLTDDVRGLNLASLALVAVNRLVVRLGRQPLTLNLFARAHAVCGHAFRRSGFLEDAGQAFGIATRTLEFAGRDAHPVVTLELCLYQMLLHLELGEHGSAEMLAESADKLYLALVDRLKQQADADSAPA